jgi:hypothetical protein
MSASKENNRHCRCKGTSARTVNYLLVCTDFTYGSVDSFEACYVGNFKSTVVVLVGDNEPEEQRVSRQISSNIINNN